MKKIIPLVLSCAFAFFGYSEAFAQRANAPAKNKTQNAARTGQKSDKTEKKETEKEKEAKRIKRIKADFERIEQRMQSVFTDKVNTSDVRAVKMMQYAKELNRLAEDPLFEKATNVKKSWVKARADELNEIADYQFDVEYFVSRSIVSEQGNDVKKKSLIIAKKIAERMKDKDDRPDDYYVKVPKSVREAKKEKEKEQDA